MDTLRKLGFSDKVLFSILQVPIKSLALYR